MAYDYEGARAAGLSEAQINEYLAKKHEYDIGGARKAGVFESDITKHLLAKEVPEAPAEPVAKPITAKDKERSWSEVITDPAAGFMESMGKLLSTPSDAQAILSGKRPEKAEGTTEALLNKIFPFGTKPTVEGVLEKLTPSKEAPAERLESTLKGVTTDITEPVAPLGRELAATAKQAKSKGLQAREAELGQKIGAEDTFAGELGTAMLGTVSDPALLFNFVSEQIPNLMGPLAGGALAKTTARALLLNASEKAIERLGVSGAVATGAVQQGADVGAEVYKSVYDGLVAQNVSEEEAHKKAIERAQVATAKAVALSVASNFIPGGTALEKSFLGKVASKEGAEVAKKTAAQRVASTTGKLAGETTQESIEEGGSKYLGNVEVAKELPDTDVMKGVGAATGMGALGGIMFGGMASIPNRAAAEQVAKAPPPPPGTKYAFDASGVIRVVDEKTGKDVQTGEQIGVMPTKQGELFTLEEAPYQVTPGDVNVEAEAKQQASDRALEQIAVLQERLNKTSNPQEAATIRDDISKLELQVQQGPGASLDTLKTEYETLARKKLALAQSYDQLNTSREATKSLNEKAAITEQMNAIESQAATIDGRLQEIITEGKKLEKQLPAKEETVKEPELKLRRPSPIVGNEMSKFGLPPRVPVRQRIKNLDMTDPAERAEFEQEIFDFDAKHPGKVNLEAVQDYLNYFNQPQTQEVQNEPTGPVLETGAGTSEPSVQLPSGELQSTEGATAPTVTGLAGTEPVVGGPSTGAGPAGETQQAALNNETITLKDGTKANLEWNFSQMQTAAGSTRPVHGVRVYAEDGEYMGGAAFFPHSNGQPNTWEPSYFILEPFRRKGIVTGIVNSFEKQTGGSVQASPNPSEDAQAFWKNRQKTTGRTQAAQEMDDAYVASKPQKSEPKTPWSQKVFGAWARSYHDNNTMWSKLFGPMQNLFSFDEAFTNRIYGKLMALQKAGDVTLDQAKQALLRISISQTLYRDLLAKRFTERGNITYDEATNRWTVVDDEVNMKAFSDKIRQLAERIGESTEWVLERVSRAYEAQRIMGMYDDLAKTKAEITRAEKAIATMERNKKRSKQEEKQLSLKKALLKQLKEDKEQYEQFTQHFDRADAQKAMTILQKNPEAREAFDIWNVMRERTIDKLVETGVMSRERATLWLDVQSYVPFSREMGEEELSGFKPAGRGIREKMATPKYKGSQRKVKNTAGNMMQWMEWSIARAISNKQIQVMIEQYKAVLPDEVRSGRGEDGNTFSVYEEGVQRFYHVADPLIAQAFTGMETLGFGLVGIASKFKQAFSHFVTRVPVFPVAQLVLMDTWVAAYTTGLKRPFHLFKEVAKEAVKTISGSNELTRGLLKSDAREYLRDKGVIATHDYQELANAEADAADVLGLATPTTFEKFKNVVLMKKLWIALDKFAAATDNVLRQAIYQEALAEGLTPLEAQEMATEFANFRRTSGNANMQAAARVIPFFNAYAQVTRVTAQTLAGTGITPKQRSEGYKVLASTAAKMAAFSFLYAALAAGDDDYWKKNRKIRDRVFVIPGTGGFSVPIRLDIFALPKLLGEYGFHMLFNKDKTDMKMVSDAVKDAMLNTVTPPTQTIITPTVGVIANHDFFHNRDIVNPTLKKLEAREQYTKSTSELSKLVGDSLNISPAKLDYWLQGMLGSIMTITSVATNEYIAEKRGIPRPAKTGKDVLASLPSMGGFVSKEDSSNALTDFYEVARDVNTVNATLENIAKTDLSKAREKLKEDDNMKKRMMKDSVKGVEQVLENISRREKLIMRAPASQMSAERKAEELKKLQAIREKVAEPALKLRKQAGY